jgi:hypothetical protein
MTFLALLLSLFVSLTASALGGQSLALLGQLNAGDCESSLKASGANGELNREDLRNFLESLGIRGDIQSGTLQRVASLLTESGLFEKGVVGRIALDHLNSGAESIELSRFEEQLLGIQRSNDQEEVFASLMLRLALFLAASGDGVAKLQTLLKLKTYEEADHFHRYWESYRRDDPALLNLEIAVRYVLLRNPKLLVASITPRSLMRKVKRVSRLLTLHTPLPFAENLMKLSLLQRVNTFRSMSNHFSEIHVRVKLYEKRQTLSFVFHAKTDDPISQFFFLRYPRIFTLEELEYLQKQHETRWVPVIRTLVSRQIEELQSIKKQLDPLAQELKRREDESEQAAAEVGAANYDQEKAAGRIERVRYLKGLAEEGQTPAYYDKGEFVSVFETKTEGEKQIANLEGKIQELERELKKQAQNFLPMAAARLPERVLKRAGAAYHYAYKLLLQFEKEARTHKEVYRPSIKVFDAFSDYVRERRYSIDPDDFLAGLALLLSAIEGNITGYPQFSPESLVVAVRGIVQEYPMSLEEFRRVENLVESFATRLDLKSKEWRMTVKWFTRLKEGTPRTLEDSPVLSELDPYAVRTKALEDQRDSLHAEISKIKEDAKASRMQQLQAEEEKQEGLRQSAIEQQEVKRLALNAAREREAGAMRAYQAAREHWESQILRLEGSQP